MANSSLEGIKTLRERTGAGMLDVKKALEEAGGDLEKAVEIIRVRGLKGVSKREGRSASDGLVAAQVVPAQDGSDQVGVMVEVNSETDFVAKSAAFVELAETVLQAAVASGVQDVDTLLAADVDDRPLADVVTQAAATLGEKIVVRRLGRVAGEHVELYLHKVNKDLPPQVGVLVATDAAGAAVARDIATHVAAFAPTYLDRAAVPETTVADERRIAEETARNEGKPEAAIGKIVEGRLQGFFKENVLLDQAFAKDPKKSVAQVLGEVGGTVTDFLRYRVGA